MPFLIVEPENVRESISSPCSIEEEDFEEYCRGSSSLHDLCASSAFYYGIHFDHLNHRRYRR